MFELADSGSSGGLSLRLSLSLSLSPSFSSRPLLPKSLSLSLSLSLSSVIPFHLLCDAVPCCVGTGVRDRVASDKARTLSSISSVSSLPPLQPFSSTFLYLVSVLLLLSSSLSFSLSHALPARFLSFPANEQTDRAWAARIAFPSTPRHFHDPTFTFGCTCSRTVTPSSSITADLLHRPAARLSPQVIFFYAKGVASFQRRKIILSYISRIHI